MDLGDRFALGIVPICLSAFPLISNIKPFGGFFSPEAMPFEVTLMPYFLISYMQ
jgi:hypothetical protein